MKRERKAVVEFVIVRKKNDPTKKTYANLMELAQAYPRCRKMWHYHHDTFGDVYGVRNWYGYDWYNIDKKKKAWSYLFRTWDRVPVFVVKMPARSFGINITPKQLSPKAKMITSPKYYGMRLKFRSVPGGEGFMALPI